MESINTKNLTNYPFAIIYLIMRYTFLILYIPPIYL